MRAISNFQQYNQVKNLKKSQLWKSIKPLMRFQVVQGLAKEVRNLEEVNQKNLKKHINHYHKLKNKKNLTSISRFQRRIVQLRLFQNLN